MKKVVLFFCLLITSFLNAQAYKGKGDIKGQVGATLQSGASGIVVSSDFGIGENMSYGFSASYLLSTQNDLININSLGVTTIENPTFIDRLDLKARFNANLGNVFQLDESMDIYPGLHLGLRNFGAHLGFRYFFTNGFGLFAEGAVPIAKYDSSITDFDTYYNQFVLNIGASFNL